MLRHLYAGLVVTAGLALALTASAAQRQPLASAARGFGGLGTAETSKAGRNLLPVGQVFTPTAPAPAPAKPAPPPVFFVPSNGLSNTGIAGTTPMTSHGSANSFMPAPGPVISLPNISTSITGHSQVQTKPPAMVSPTTVTSSKAGAAPSNTGPAAPKLSSGGATILQPGTVSPSSGIANSTPMVSVGTVPAPVAGRPNFSTGITPGNNGHASPVASPTALISPAPQPLSRPSFPPSQPTSGTVATTTPASNPSPVSSTVSASANNGNPTNRTASTGSNSVSSTLPGSAAKIQSPASTSTQSAISPQVTALQVSSPATTALNTLTSVNAIKLTSATSSNGYIYPSTVSASNTSLQQQCAVLVQALQPVGLTENWKPVGYTPSNPQGVNIQNANLTAGTPIATFMTTGQYPTGSTLMNTLPANLGASREPHSAIFLNYLTDSNGNVALNGNGKPIGMEMLAQSAGTPATIEYRLFENVPDTSPYSKYQVANYPYSAIETSSATSISDKQ